jgi:hypothetical protein
VLRGFDVSAFQGTSVPVAHFIFIKAVEGRDYTSSKFDAQWADAKRKGMLRGAYCFARPEESPGASQADRLIAKARAVPGEMLCLDLEASDLNQAATNAWARAFGDRLREKAPGVTTVLYMGRGYASNNTGRDLSQHFDFWWMPQYPSSRSTTTWPTSFSPAVPSPNTTGWAKPHIWQWTSNFNGLDANISPLTLDQLAAGGQPLEDDMAQVSSLGAGGTLSVPAGGHADVKWTKEFSDRHHLHGDNGVSVVIAADTYWCLADAQFELRGLTPGATLDVAWTRVKDDGTFIDDTWRKTFTANAAGVIRDDLGGQFSVDATNRVRLRVYNPGSKALSLTVVATDAKKIPVTMAKASLLKY